MALLAWGELISNSALLTKQKGLSKADIICRGDLSDPVPDIFLVLQLYLKAVWRCYGLCNSYHREAALMAS